MLETATESGRRSRPFALDNSTRNILLRDRRHSAFALLVFALFLVVPSLLAAEELLLEKSKATLTLPQGWVTTSRASNIHVRKLPPASLQDGKGALHGPMDPNAPRMVISTETRRDHDGALRRLLDIGGIRGATWEFLEIGGWPALQQKYLRDRPQPSGGGMPGSEKILVLQTVVAAGNELIRMETWLTPDASAADIAEVEAIGRSLLTPTRGNPSEVAKAIEDLQQGYAPGRSTPANPLDKPEQPQAKGSKSVQAQPGRNQIHVSKAGLPDAGYSVPVSTAGGRDSELEIAVSPDGRDIVIGSNGPWSFSNDGGQTWTNASLNGNDPSVAWGQSGGARGTFYGANIATPSTGMWRSTDGGATWVSAPVVYTCTQNGDANCAAAFPDQHHIASDRLNVTAGGDQVYSAWRHLDGNWGVVCTQDSGVTWSANAYFRAGDFPKPAVGPDGMVYVIYIDGDDIMLDKFAPCEVQGNPMANQAGFPAVVKADVVPVACPTPGLDRCNRRNTLSGITVAVDDTDPDHVYVTYAENTNPGSGGAFVEGSPVCNDQNLCNEDIIVQDSLDGGESWSTSSDRMVVVSSGVTARRFMPWVCTIDGTAWVSWYDRRAAFPGGTVESNNSLTDFFAASASLDAVGDLAANGEFQVNDPGTSDAQCESGFATGSANSWPAAVDRDRDSDDCSVQPQLGGICQNSTPTCNAGFCSNNPAQACTQNSNCFVQQPPGNVRCDLSDCGGNGNNNGSAQCACTAGFTCDIGRGSPKYGDYNGNACAAGRLYMTWASAEAPLAFPAATDIDSFFSSEVVCCVPQIQVPGDVDFGDACGLDQQEVELPVCNTGAENLVVSSVSGDGPFAVSTPLGGWPVTISPDFCFNFEVTFDPTDVGDEAGTLVVNSNDPVNPAFEVPVTGSIGEADIDVFIANSGDFGEVCSGLFHDLNLTVQNNGQCDLEIDAVTLLGPDADDFLLPDGSFEGTLVEPGNSLQIPVRFQPDECSDESLNSSISIASNDPDEGLVSVDISGVSPCPNLVIDPAGLTGLYAFPATVVDTTETLGCFNDRSATLRNAGDCPLRITAISADGDIDSDDFDVIDPTLPGDQSILLPPGQETLAVSVRFTPQSDDDYQTPNSVTGTLTVVSNDPDSPHTAPLCGESATQSGIRTLVTDVTSGVPEPVDPVESMTVRSKGKNTPSPINLMFTDQPVSMATVCGNEIYYHLNLENLPAVETTGGRGGKSQYEVYAREGNLQDSRSFSLDQCEFKEFQMELKSSDGDSCLGGQKGETCDTAADCCSGKCTGKPGAKTCN